MSSTSEKQFVIKNVFYGVKDMYNNMENHGNPETHFGVPWRIALKKEFPKFNISLQCLKDKGNWSIDTAIRGCVIGSTGEKAIMGWPSFPSENCSVSPLYINQLKKYLVDDNLTVEMIVTIRKMKGAGIETLKHFDESNKKFSDMVLVVKDEKFYVNKLFLASHSTYFESLFLGDFNEAQKSEVELKDIDPWEFQKFLEVIYGEPAMHECTITGILKLADFFDSQTAMKRCEGFLMDKSTLSLKDKFNAAIKYKMENLKKRCMSELKTSAEYKSIVPNDPTDWSHAMWKELYLKVVDLIK